jgi:hypothetical protein
MPEINENEDEQVAAVEATPRTHLIMFGVLVAFLWLLVGSFAAWLVANDLKRNPSADVSTDILTAVLVASIGTGFLARVLL